MNESILIVEDEQELCSTLGDRLWSEGHEALARRLGNLALFDTVAILQRLLDGFSNPSKV